VLEVLQDEPFAHVLGRHVDAKDGFEPLRRMAHVLLAQLAELGDDVPLERERIVGGQRCKPSLRRLGIRQGFLVFFA